MILKAECKLTYCEGTSDKVYYIRLYNDCGEYSTLCEYGRRGYTLKEVAKAIRISESRAMVEFDKVRKEKIAKGYVQEHMNWFEPTTIEPEPAKEPVIVEDVRTCSDEARQKALERLRAACANE
jgi:hypothetical protein